MAGPSWTFLSQLNDQRRQQEPPLPQTLVLKNVLYFFGNAFHGPSDVYIHDGKIVEQLDGAEELDCAGKFLIPGLIDAHTHPMTVKDLESLTKHGVTTTMSMAGFDSAHMASLKGHPGLVDVMVAGLPAAGPDNKHTIHIPGWPKDEMLTDSSQAESFVSKQIERGAEYIKIIADVPGLDQELVTACVDAGKKHGKLTICHAATLEPVRQALRAKADQLHHSPMDGPFHDEDIQMYKQTGSIVCPTLSMMEAIANNSKSPEIALENAKRNVSLLHGAGVTILCGTDSNEAPGTPGKVTFGSSVHRELELLVSSGLSTTEAILSATLLPARHFGLQDRGIIAPGYRADLVLLSADPIKAIKATSGIEKVWLNGILYA